MRSLKSRNVSGGLAKCRRGLPLIAVCCFNLVNAQQLDLQDLPLFVGSDVPPNIIVSFDDSGSMSFGFMPDSIQVPDDSSSRPEAKSSKYNFAYYDPSTPYEPPYNHLGVQYADAVFTSADPNFFGVSANGFADANVDLSTSFRVRWNPVGFGGWGPAFASDGGSDAGQAAYYYQFDEDNCDDSQIKDDACYTKIVVGATSGPGGTDERTNFANWFQYYSYRSIAAKTALSRAFGPNEIPESFRVARQTIRQRGPKSGDPGSGVTGGNSYLAELTEAQREYFYKWIWNIETDGGTPLRRTINEAGSHFSLGSSNANSPYRIIPGDASSEELSCRVNSHVLLTDGNWNGSAPDLPGTDDLDHQNETLPETIEGISQYTANSTNTAIYYHDDYHGTDAVTNLADYAFHYWVNDLRTDLANNVPPNYVEKTGEDDTISYPADFWNPANDPATWQHMRNYIVAFGTAGRVPLTDSVYQDLLAGRAFEDTQGTSSIGWRSSSTFEFRTDDAYHAALNSRGAFFSAQNPGALVDAFARIATNLTDDNDSVATVTVNSGSISTDSLLYQATYDPENWTGELIAFEVSDGSGIDDPSVTGCNARPLGTRCSQIWSAAERSDADYFDHTSRDVFSYVSTSTGVNPAGNKINFTWAGLSTAQQTLLDGGDGFGEQRVNYLRGDASNEGTLFRQRSNVEATGAGARLGPVVHSSPVYAGRGVDANGSRQFGFPDDLETASYSSFVSSISGRPEMVYVGSNDGMLHAYNASDSASGGQEVFSYVPSPVMKNLKNLTDPNFVSDAYVDGPVRVQDVFYGGSWETLLVGGLRTGGQGYYALEVTEPQSATASSIVRWEYTDENDADMGYTYGAPLLVRANNDKWVVIVANGYNSAEADGNQGSGDAVLFVLDAETGERLAKFAVGSTSGTNGLSSPVAISADGDFNADYVYAGDLEGNMWKFDMTSDDPSNWSTVSLLYSAGASRAITAAPTVGSHPLNLGGRVVYFGTGQYVEPDDIESTSSQRFYAIWDQDNGTVTSGLLAQTLDTPADVRQISENPIDWSIHNGWYLNLSATGTTPAERVIGKANVLGSVIAFTTIIPSGDVCEGNVESYLFGINRSSGGAFDEQVFDTNNDGIIDSDDMTSSGENANVIKLNNYAGETVYVGEDVGELGAVYAGDEVTIIDNFGSSGRIRWRQLQ